MDAYRICCSNCGMKAKFRLDRFAATRIAEEHARETGHSVTIRDVGASRETVVTGEGSEEEAETAPTRAQD